MPTINQKITIRAETDWFRSTILTPGPAWGAVATVKSDLKVHLPPGTFMSGVPFSLQFLEAQNAIELHAGGASKSTGPTLVVIDLSYDSSLPYVTIRSEKGAAGNVWYTSNVSTVAHDTNAIVNVQLAL